MNKISNLLKSPFADLPISDKLEVKRLGKPCPQLVINQHLKTNSGKNFTRLFSIDYYTKYEWLCGCDVKNKLFCFPCVLFGGEETWAHSGFDDINHLVYAWKKHEQGKAHLKNVTRYTLLGKKNLTASTSGAYKKNIEDHNREVAENRFVLNVIINCIKYCDCFDLALRGVNDSSNPAIFRGLINFSTELNSCFRNNIENWQTCSEAIQNELLDCMLEVCQEHIADEISDTEFFSLIVNEISDISNKAFQVAITFRYLIGDRPVDRFFCLLKPDGNDPKTLAVNISKTIANLKIENIKERIIAQTYDGPSVMNGRNESFQPLIKKIYPRANFVHCFDHDLNLILTKVASINADVRIFFANLNGLCAFFSQSPEMTAVLDKVGRKTQHKSTPIRWNFHSRSVVAVLQNKPILLECLKEIIYKSLNDTLIQQATGLLKILEDHTFNFWLKFFNFIIPYADFLNGYFQKREVDPAAAKLKISHFENVVMIIRNVKIDKFEILVPGRKRAKIDFENEKKEAKEVCDIILMEMKNRFEFIEHWSAASLLMKEQFFSHQKTFPKQIVKDIIKVYPLKWNRLRTELKIIYSTAQFYEIPNVEGFLTVISENNLSDVLKEVYKMCKILITTPTLSSEAERAVSTVKKLKIFLGNAQCHEKLNALAMLSIEKDLVHSIEDFNSKVIEKFARLKDGRLHLQYK